MGRRSGFAGAVNSFVREMERQSRYAAAEMRRRERDGIRAQKMAERARVLAFKEERLRYIEGRILEVEDLNEELDLRIDDIKSLIEKTLKVNHKISFDSLRIKEKYQAFNPPKNISTPYKEPEKSSFIGNVKAPGFFARLIPGSGERYQKALSDAEKRYVNAIETYKNSEARRLEEYEKLEKEYETGKKEFEIKVQKRDQEVNEFESAYRNGEIEAVITYNTMVLERLDYPEGFSQQFRLAYVPESKELVIEYELPWKDIIPEVEEFKYVKTKDEITEKARKITEIKELYQDLIASVTLRTIYEVINADQGITIEVVVFNGLVITVDPATGNDIHPCLISIRVTKENFTQLDLSRVEKTACLRNLGAMVSSHPAELKAVKPIIEFNMVDKRFVDNEDIMSALESRPNLMDLNPFEFEQLVTNLFNRMGLETKQTRSSRDGGVDAVAFDMRPIVGGKVVIQAKRYKNTVGVSAVRDLYGTMMNEGANKGILVTTSGYGPDAFDFANDKPIELIDGGGLLYLLEQNEVPARIIFPEV